MEKKLFSVIIVFVMMISTLTGCSGSDTKSDTDSKANVTAAVEDDKGIDFSEEPYEVNFLCLVASEGRDQEEVNDAINKLTMKELNMKVNLIPMTFGTYMSQISMILASNEALDIFPCGSANFSSYIDAQYILNLNDYLDYAPDALKILGEDAYSASVGDFLVGFGQMKERAMPAGLIVRKDIFDEFGYKAEDFNVTTDDYSSFDQISQMFAKVKEMHPNMVCLDGIYIMGLQDASYYDKLGSNFGVLEDYGQATKITNWFEAVQFQNFCKIAADWHQKGYTSSDIAINSDAGEIKMKAGNCFSFIGNIKPNTQAEKASQTGYDVEVIPVSKQMKSGGGINDGVFAIAHSSKDPKKAMQFLNWAYTSREFNDLINWGIEGKNWVETSDGQAAYPEGVNAANVGYHNDFGWAYPNQFIAHAWVGNPIDIWDQYQTYNANLIKSKAFGFTFDPRSVATEEAQLNAVSQQYLKDLAFGVIDVDSGLKEFNDALYAAGLQTVMDEKQRQLDEWLKTQK